MCEVVGWAGGGGLGHFIIVHTRKTHTKSRHICSISLLQVSPSVSVRERLDVKPFMPHLRVVDSSGYHHLDVNDELKTTIA